MAINLIRRTSQAQKNQANHNLIYIWNLKGTPVKGLGLVVQAVVSHPTWVPGTRFEPSGRASLLEQSLSNFSRHWITHGTRGKLEAG